jgi:hypothetical protein
MDGYEQGNCVQGDFDSSTLQDFKVSNCPKVLYDDFEFTKTVVTDHNLICDEQYKVSIYYYT